MFMMFVLWCQFSVSFCDYKMRSDNSRFLFLFTFNSFSDCDCFRKCDSVAFLFVNVLAFNSL